MVATKILAAPAFPRNRWPLSLGIRTNGFIEAINGLFQAAKRKARGYTRFRTMKTVLFLIAEKLNFSSINPHATA